MNTLLTHKASNCLNSYWGIIGLCLPRERYCV
jgi:hypothetical protein